MIKQCAMHMRLHVHFYAGLAYIIQSPSNQTICSGAPASFQCISDNPSTITWLVNGQDPISQGIASPATIPQSPGVMSTLIVPGNTLSSGSSIVCGDDQNYSASAFLKILGTQ